MRHHSLKPFAGSTKSKKRIGRGQHGGNFSGRGMKGQGSRTGADSPAAFEGGQTPLVRRMPKLKGFKNPNKVVYLTVNLDQLNDAFKDGDKVDAKALMEKRIVTRKGKIKLLGTGDLKVKLTISVDAASQSAQSKVEKAGGELKLPKATEKASD